MKKTDLGKPVNPGKSSEKNTAIPNNIKAVVVALNKESNS